MDSRSLVESGGIRATCGLGKACDCTSEEGKGVRRNIVLRVRVRVRIIGVVIAIARSMLSMCPCTGTLTRSCRGTITPI